MIYAISDLHGYPLGKFKALLNKVSFCNDDFLYILSDVIDRNGDGGVEMLCWLLEQSNVQLILGNHEAMLLSVEFVFNEITEKSVADFTSEKLELLNTYMQNGGDVTLKAFRGLQNKSRNRDLLTLGIHEEKQVGLETSTMLDIYSFFNSKDIGAYPERYKALFYKHDTKKSVKT